MSSYIEEPAWPPLEIVMDVELESVGSECATPEITSVLYEGAWHVNLLATGISDGIYVSLSTGDTGAFFANNAHIVLSSPLVAGDVIYAEIDTENCKTRSCNYTVLRIKQRLAFCDIEPFTQAAGLVTGGFLCVEKDLYAEVHDGEGGVYPGILIQESCVVCGGINPNCDEEEGVPRYWNLVKCANGTTYQTDTPILIAGQRVTSLVHGNMRWDGTYIDTLTPSNYIGSVSIVSGQTGCPSGGGGGGGTTYWNIVSCADGLIYQTTTPLTFPNQRVSHETFGEHYWNGTTTGTASALRGTVTPLADTGCSSGGGGGDVFYNIVSCAGGGVYQTTTVLTAQGQRVTTPLGEHYWDGTTQGVATHPRTSAIMYNPDGTFVYGCG